MAAGAPPALELLDSKDMAQRAPGRGGGAGGRNEGREVMVSKALSKLLRHRAEEAGIKLDGEGFAPLDKVLEWPPLKAQRVSLDEIKSIVDTDPKKRFTLKLNPAVVDPASRKNPSSPEDYLIRANQGHSLTVDPAAMFRPIALGDADFPSRVLHGTYFVFWERILASGGLRPMGRGHIHCSDRTPEEGAVSGMRRDAELLVEIDIEGSLREGVLWWRSQNGVILTDGGAGGVLGTRFFRRVVGRAAGVGLLWEDGVKRADFPAGLRMVVPRGMRGRGGRRGGKVTCVDF